MKNDAQNLPESLELSHKIILTLRDELTKLAIEKAELIAYKEKYARLLEELRLDKHRLYGSSSEKNLLQRGLFDESGVELSDEIKAQLDDENDKNDEIEVKGHTRKKHPIRKALPEELPREVIVHDIGDHEKVCDCGAGLVRIGEEISEQLKYIPAQLSVVQHVRPKYACKPCQQNVKIAPMPELLLPKSIATAELIAYTIVAKYADHIPLYRQEGIWQRLEIDLPRSSLCGWTLKAAELCEPLIDELQKSIVQYDYAQADETTVQVLDEVGRDNTQKSYMWCYRGGLSERPSIVFEYQETRSGCHAKDFLSGFKGYLQTDAYSGYEWIADKKEIIGVNCNAHGRRPFAELARLTKTPGLAHEALKFYRKLYSIEALARENNLSADARHLLRNEKAPPIWAAFKKWLEYHLPKTSEQGKIGKSIGYMLTHWSGLTAYLKDGRIEIDNNLIENAIRPFALGRKNWLFAGSPRGAKAGATLYSLLETCKANQVEPYQYFCTMLNRIRQAKTADDYRQLLPHFIQF